MPAFVCMIKLKQKEDLNESIQKMCKRTKDCGDVSLVL